MIEKERPKRDTLSERAANLQKQETNKEAARSKTTTMLATALLAVAIASVPIYNKIKMAVPTTNAPHVIMSSDSKFANGNQYVISKKDLANTVIEIKGSDVGPTRIRFDQNGDIKQEFDLQIYGKKKTVGDKDYSNVSSVGVAFPGGSMVFILDKQSDGSIKVTRSEYKNSTNK